MRLTRPFHGDRWASWLAIFEHIELMVLLTSKPAFNHSYAANLRSHCLARGLSTKLQRFELWSGVRKVAYEKAGTRVRIAANGRLHLVYRDGTAWKVG